MRVIKRLLAGILILIFFFTIIMPFGEQFVSLIDAFVDQNANMFQFQVPITKFKYDNGTIQETQEYYTVDLSIIVKFAIRFLVYVIAPFGAFIVAIRGRW